MSKQPGKKLIYEEAKQRFIDQGRADIELIEEGFKGWKKKSKFWDNEIGKEFWSRPDAVYRKKACHPERSVKARAKLQTLSYEEAKQRFIDQGRNDIELIEEGYVRWAVKSKFYDKVVNKYFSATPRDVYNRRSCHPKRSIKIRSEKITLSFLEAKQKFDEQGRTDIELIEEGFKGWKKKSKFWDKEVKEYFWALPYSVHYKKSCHIKRKAMSRNQLKLFNELRDTFTGYDFLLERKVVVSNIKYYMVDILFEKYKIIIEYNGDYWHCNPLKYKEDFLHPIKKKAAKEIWKEDEVRVNNLKEVGYKVLVVWENDYKKNKEQVLSGLKERINNIVKENKNG